MKHSPRRSAFSLIDLAVLLAILGILFGMLFVALMKVREENNRSTCQNNLKQIGIAVHNYAGAYEATAGGKLPPMLDYDPVHYGWKPFWFSLWPFMESANVSAPAIGTGAAWNAGNHAVVFKSMLCPSDPTPRDGLCTSGKVGWSGTSYAPVFQLFGSENELHPEAKVYISAGKYHLEKVLEGSGNQIAVVERLTSFPLYDASNAMLYPESWSYWGWNTYGSVYGVWGLHPPQTSARSTGSNAANPIYPSSAQSMCNVLRLDGRIDVIRSDIEPALWARLCNPDARAAPGPD